MIFITLLFVTGNPHKFREAEKILKPYKIGMRRLDEPCEEIRAEDVKDVAQEAGRALFRKIRKPLLVEDSGLFINSLNGFPGAYSAWAQRKIGNEGILRLLAGVNERSAYFKSCVAYVDANGAKTFCGTVRGHMSGMERGKKGFGYDPVFVPEEHNPRRQTFAENEMLKNRISHRFNAFTAFARWYTNYIPKKQQRDETIR